MRFDILDEYSTLVPFGFGVSRHNRVVRYPADPVKAVERGVTAKYAGHSKLLLELAAALRHLGRREQYRQID